MTDISTQRSGHDAVRRPGTVLRNIVRVVAACGVLGLSWLYAGGAAFAQVPPPDGGSPAAPAPTYVVSSSGMAGWQIALIALAAAASAALLTAMIDRLRVRALHPATG